MVLRQVLLAASSSDRVEAVVRTAGLGRKLTGRYVAGDSAEQAAAVAAGVVADGLLVSLDHLGEEVRDADQAAHAVKHSLELLDGLARYAIARGADITVRLSRFGLHLDEKLAEENAARVCQAAAEAGATVTVETERPAIAESVLRVHARLLERAPETGVAVQSSWRRAEEYCRSLSSARVRLSRGVLDAPASVSYQEPAEVDRSYVRCLKVLMAGQGRPALATHDRRLIEVASALAVLNEREPDSFEYQMAYGMRPAEQHRLAENGSKVRVRIPYGPDWYAHLTRHLAERPANLGVVARSLVGR